MEKVNKLEMFYDLASTQGIQTGVPLLVTTIIAHIFATKTSMPEIDQLADVASLLTVESLPCLQFQQRGPIIKINDPP